MNFVEYLKNRSNSIFMWGTSDCPRLKLCYLILSTLVSWHPKVFWFIVKSFHSFLKNCTNQFSTKGMSLGQTLCPRLKPSIWNESKNSNLKRANSIALNKVAIKYETVTNSYDNSGNLIQSFKWLYCKESFEFGGFQISNDSLLMRTIFRKSIYKAKRPFTYTNVCHVRTSK